MLAAMGLAALACIFIGVFPALLYSHLPYSVDYVPYTVRHVMSTLGLLAFTALGFFLLLKHLDPEPTVSLDTDWFYRRGLTAVLSPIQEGFVRLERVSEQIYEFVMRRPVMGIAVPLREIDTRVIDAAAVGLGRLVQVLSERLKTTVSGHAQHYGLAMAVGVVVAVAFVVFGL